MIYGIPIILPVCSRGGYATPAARASPRCTGICEKVSGIVEICGFLHLIYGFPGRSYPHAGDAAAAGAKRSGAPRSVRWATGNLNERKINPEKK